MQIVEKAAREIGEQLQAHKARSTSSLPMCCPLFFLCLTTSLDQHHHLQLCLPVAQIWRNSFPVLNRQLQLDSRSLNPLFASMLASLMRNRNHVTKTSKQIKRMTTRIKIFPDAGAFLVDSWSPLCTHLLAEDGTTPSPLVYEAVGAGKPVVNLEWIQAFAGRDHPSKPVPDPSK
jgi:hypothetical protein